MTSSYADKMAVVRSSKPNAAETATVEKPHAEGMHPESSNTETLPSKAPSMSIWSTINLQRLLIYASVIFIVWIPWLVALYPGSMNWDTVYQITQCYPSNSQVWVIPEYESGSLVEHHFSDHHPLFVTLIYGAFALSSEALFGTWNYGLFFFVLLQAIATACSLACSIVYAEALGCPRKIVFASVAFCAIMPFFPLYAADIVKDSFFSWLFVLWLIFVLETVRTKGAALNSGKALGGFIVLCLLLCLTKKTGFYIVLATLVVLAIVYRKNKGSLKRLLLSAGSCALLMWVLLPLLVFPALDVIPGGKQEMFGSLFNMTARMTVEHPDDISDDEKAAIAAVLPFENLPNLYEEHDFDRVKAFYVYESNSADLANYLRVWFAQGLRHPLTYLKALWGTSGPLLSPGKEIAGPRESGDKFELSNGFVQRPSSLDGYRNVLFDAYDFVLQIPILNLLFQCWTYSVLVPAITIIWAAIKRSRIRLAYIPVLLSILVLLISPVPDPRYMLPLVYTTPLLILLTCTKSLWQHE